MTVDTYRILIPSEYLALLDVVPKEHHEMMIKTMMNTGARYKELRAFGAHLEWFDSKNNAIVIPAAHTKTRIARTIHLTPTFSKDLSKYLLRHKSLEFPDRHAMNQNLRRWWISSEWKGMITPIVFQGWLPTPKTFRKSWESWLLMAEFSIHKVAMSQGHTVAVSEHHYANLSPRLKSEMELVKKMTEGWGT